MCVFPMELLIGYDVSAAVGCRVSRGAAGNFSGGLIPRWSGPGGEGCFVFKGLGLHGSSEAKQLVFLWFGPF